MSMNAEIGVETAADYILDEWNENATNKRKNCVNERRSQRLNGMMTANMDAMLCKKGVLTQVIG